LPGLGTIDPEAATMLAVKRQLGCGQLQPAASGMRDAAYV